MWTRCHVRMQLHFYNICHIIIWCCSLKLLQPWVFQIHMHVRLSNLFNVFYKWSPSKCWFLDGDIEVWIDVYPLTCSTMLWDLSTTHPTTFLNLFRTYTFKAFRFQFQFVTLSFVGYWHYVPPWQQQVISLGDPSFFLPMVLTISSTFHQLQALPLMLQIHLQWKWTYSVLHHTL